MALINVAGVLAGRGFRVLVLDMDLEAPGISYLRERSVDGDDQPPGFVDLLLEAVERGPDADLVKLPPIEVLERYSYDYTIPEAIRSSNEGVLRIMPAGRLDGGYSGRLDRFGIGKLYEAGQGRPLIEAFKIIVQEAHTFDLVFIDSRTGFSDEAGICTRDLGEYLVVVMGFNRQNVEGTAGFLEALRLSNVRPRGLQIIFSPVPNGEDDLLDEREREALSRLEQVWGAELSPPFTSPIILGLHSQKNPTSSAGVEANFSRHTSRSRRQSLKCSASAQLPSSKKLEPGNQTGPEARARTNSFAHLIFCENSARKTTWPRCSA